MKLFEIAPSRVDGMFLCTNNRLTSLQGIPSIVGSNVSFIGNNITSFHHTHKHIKQINGTFNCEAVGDMLSLLYINGLIQIITSKHHEIVGQILTKHLKDRDVDLCQDELIDAGYPKAARL